MPQGPGSGDTPRSGFFAEDASEQFSPAQLENQFLFADLDAQQSAVAERRLLGEVDSDYTQFFVRLAGDQQRETAIRKALIQAHRELTDFRLAQSMGGVGDRQRRYEPATNYVLSRLKSLLDESEIAELDTVMRRNSWEKFKPSFGAQVRRFARESDLPFAEGEINHLVAIHFDSSYLLLNPHALGESSQQQRMRLQREALALTRRELAVNLAAKQRASADVFIDAQLIELDNLAALLE
tara:strand:+ start:340 stop:1056 length:717 start_codon:yes stop_codon:yes gene_type:complete